MSSAHFAETCKLSHDSRTEISPRFTLAHVLPASYPDPQPMTQHLADATRAAIENLALQRMTAPEIRRRLLAGTAGVPKVEAISLRRVQQIAAEAKRQAQPVDPLPDDPDSYTEQILKRSLANAGSQLKRINGKQRKTDADAESMVKWSRAIAAIRKELGVLSARSKNPTKTAAGDTPPPPSTLELLAGAASSDRPASESASPPSSNGQSNGNGHEQDTEGQHDTTEEEGQGAALSASRAPLPWPSSSGTDPSSTTTTWSRNHGHTPHD